MTDLNLYTTAEINALTPQSGDLVVDTELNSVKLWNGAAWKVFNHDAAAASFSNTYSVDFDGTNDYMTCGSVTQINSVTNLSTSSWFKIDAYQGGSGPIILGGHSVSPGNEFFVQAYNTTSIRYAHNGTYNTSASGSIPAGSWHNVVTVQAGTSLTVYLNGTSILSTTVSAVDSGWGSNFTIGKWSGGGYNYMNGHIDEVALFTSALSASDVTAIYNSGTPNDISSLSPVAWYRMGDNDSGSGTTITDQGSGGNDATLINGPTFSTDIPLGPLVLPSITNTYALSFDGSNDYVDTGVSTGLAGASEMTLSFWFKSDTAGEGPSIGSRTGSTNQWGFLRAGSANYMQIVTGGTGKYFSYASPADTAFHHYLLTFSGGDVNFYIDGSLVSVSWSALGSGTVPVLHSESVSFDIGRNATFYSHGLMDEVAVFNSALTQREITAMYNSGTPNDISSLSPLGWWRCGDNDSGSGTTITDQGSGGNDATLINGPTFSTSIPS